MVDIELGPIRPGLGDEALHIDDGDAGLLRQLDEHQVEAPDPGGEAVFQAQETMGDGARRDRRKVVDQEGRLGPGPEARNHLEIVLEGLLDGRQAGVDVAEAKPQGGRFVQERRMADGQVSAGLEAAKMAHRDVGQDRQDDGVGVGLEQRAAGLHGQGVGLQRRRLHADRIVRRWRMHQPPGPGRGFMAQADDGLDVPLAQQLVDAVPDRLAADPAIVQGLQHVDIAFGEELQSSHTGTGPPGASVTSQR